MSRKHCEIICDSKDQFWIKDISKNGTLLNGKKLEKGKEVLLHEGDEIGLLFEQEENLSIYHMTFGLIFSLIPLNNPNTSPPKKIQTKSTVKQPKQEEEEEEEENASKNSEESEDDQTFVGPTEGEEEGEEVEEDYEEDASGSKRKASSQKSKKIKKKPKITPPEPEKKGRRADRILKWTVEEEEKLIKLMKKNEGRSWKDIAVHFPLRSPDALRNKYKKMVESKKH